MNTILGFLIIGCMSAAIVGWIRVILRPRLRSREGPACGACGYSVEGVSTFNCAECGKDYREVGILAARARTSNGDFQVMLYLLRWVTALLLVVGLIYLSAAIVGF